MKRSAVLFVLTLLTLPLAAQSRYNRDFKKATDSLSVLLHQRTSVQVKLQLKNVMLRGNEMDLYYTESLMDFPWREKDIPWFRERLEKLWPASCRSYKLGRIFSNGVELEELPMPLLSADGKARASKFARKDPKGTRLVRRVGEMKFPRGLTGRHIALWQSHGRYFDQGQDSWSWQRSHNWLTTEDLLTQSFVLPYLIPMLEHAGAYVLTPRERDTQRAECVCDNDPAFSGPRGEGIRTRGTYAETGAWTSAGVGFADTSLVYKGLRNPFRTGTARKTACARKSTATAVWTADLPAAGEYAVYVSYKSLPESTTAARYTVRHKGGETAFIVNQHIGGGTWIYLGTFPFDKGTGGSVTLDNGTPDDAKFKDKTVVTADGVRFGGGMGKVARGAADERSGLPAYLEGALYNMQWAGVDSTLLSAQTGDYTNDYASRGAWVCRLAGGSWAQPKTKGLGIPIDLSLAFHTDAGVTPNDSIVGTLAIYTLKCDGKRELPDGTDRMIGREYADRVQTQIVQDLRARWNPAWSRRGTWDRSYSESRTTGVPGMLLELLSHQNFADMKYGLDPQFRFDVARAVYKGMLKFLSTRYEVPYVVQPLPVHAFAASLSGDKVRLSWEATLDPLEKTAVPKGFLLQRRLGDGAFDEGTPLKASLSGGRYSAEVDLPAGQVVSFRIVAYNDGGLSFPSETLAAGRGKGREVLVVNNFTRISSPAWFDDGARGGFDRSLDVGVPDGKDITFSGEQFEFRRDAPWTHNFDPGFGGCDVDQAGFQLAGNTFDYVALHGQALLEAGYSFSSASVEAFCREACDQAWALDLICGKQLSTPTGHGALPARFRVFPEELREALSAFAGDGGHLLVSGARIGTDLWDSIYPVCADTAYSAQGQAFVQSTLGWKRQTGRASRSGRVRPMKSSRLDAAALPGSASFYRAPNETFYCADNVDGIVPASDKAFTFLRYADSNVSAAVGFDAGTYRAVSAGFPLETLQKREDRVALLSAILKYFEKQ